MRRAYTIPTCGAQRPVADDFALQLHWCDAETTTAKKPDMCWYKRGFLKIFFVKADVLFWKRSSFVDLEESVRVPSFVPSSLRHRCRSWRLMFLKSVSRLPDYPTLKNDSHEAWKCSVTRKKYFERPHTQRCSDGSGWEQHPVPKRSFWRQTLLSSSLISTRTPY